MTATVTLRMARQPDFVMTFTPGNEEDAFKNFLVGVIGMVGSDDNSVGAMRPNQFKVVDVTGSEFSDKNYYAVPVTVTIDLERLYGLQGNGNGSWWLCTLTSRTIIPAIRRAICAEWQ